MNEWDKTPLFEESVRQSFGVPEIRPEFVKQLASDLQKHTQGTIQKTTNFPKLRPIWTVVFSLLIVLTVSTLAIGPQRVFAAVRGLFGYIPEVGIIDQSAPLRILAEPVSITREGITISVNQAILTVSETRLNFGISGVPLSAYSDDENGRGCVEREYFMLADGSIFDSSAPLPAAIRNATLILPCIPDTLPGTAPTDWQIPLKFIPAPEDLVIFPVVEVSPSITTPAEDLQTTTSTPNSPEISSTSAIVAIKKVIETDDGYILIGSVSLKDNISGMVQINGAPILRDVNGKKVSYTFPQVNTGMIPNGYSWAFQIKGADIVFPLSIEFSGILLLDVGPSAPALIEFDAGPNPLPDHVWNLNHEFELAGMKFWLSSITRQENGYSFLIKTDPEQRVSSVQVQILEHQAIGGGGGGTPGGSFTYSLVYEELPTGSLEVSVSNPIIGSGTEIWQGNWQPDIVRIFDTTPPNPEFPICLDSTNLASLQPVSIELNGKMLVTQLNPELQIVMSDYHGKQQKVLVPGMIRGAVSPDGNLLAYSDNNGIVIKNLLTEQVNVLKGAQGRDFHWSADGSQLAYVSTGDSFGVFVIATDGQSSARQLSNLGYESLAGWSPDGKEVYFAIPSASDNSFELRSVNLESEVNSTLFLLPDSSRKAPMPAISQDGLWLTYRGSDNSSLYLIGMDGNNWHKVVEPPSPGYAITGIAWSPNSDIIGISLITPEEPNGQIILLQHSACQTYLVPAIHGILEGLFTP